MAETFRRGDNILSPTFRQRLNSVADAAERNRPNTSGHGTQTARTGRSNVHVPFPIFGLFQVKSGESWATGTTDSVTDDVTSATCERLLWINTDDATTPNEYLADSGNEVEVYNSIEATTEPAAGDKLLAVWNQQSGRWELLV